MDMTQELHEQWHKVAMVLMNKLGEKRVTITSEDVQALTKLFPGDIPVIIFHARESDVLIEIISQTEAEKLAREAGGKTKLQS